MMNLEQNSADGKPSETSVATPLNREEVLALLGAGVVVVGTLLPALDPGLGEKQSFLKYANTATLVLWSLAVSAFWSIARRRAAEAVTPSLLILGSLLVFGSFVWLEELREETRTFWGTLKAHLSPVAWCVIAVGATVTMFAGRRSQLSTQSVDGTNRTTGYIRSFGATLALLGCLLGLGAANPFTPEASLEIRRMWAPYSDEIHLLRWLLLGGAAVACVCFWQQPKFALRYLPGMIFFCLVLMGNGGFILLCMEMPRLVPLSVLAGVVWTLFSVCVWLNNSSGKPVARWRS